MPLLSRRLGNRVADLLPARPLRMPSGPTSSSPSTPLPSSSSRLRNTQTPSSETAPLSCGTSSSTLFALISVTPPFASSPRSPLLDHSPEPSGSEGQCLLLRRSSVHSGPPGLLGFPPRNLQHRFLSRFKSVFYIRQRDYSKVGQPPAAQQTLGPLWGALQPENAPSPPPPRRFPWPPSSSTTVGQCSASTRGHGR